MYSTVYRRNKNRNRQKKQHFIFRATKLSVLGGKKITGEILFFLGFLVGEILNIKKNNNNNNTFYMILSWRAFSLVKSDRVIIAKDRGLVKSVIGFR